jgi:hypothetical protein
MKYFNGNKMTDLVTILRKSKRWMHTDTIASDAKVEWHTTMNYLRFMLRQGWIANRKIGNRNYWRGYTRAGSMSRFARTETNKKEET